MRQTVWDNILQIDDKQALRELVLSHTGISVYVKACEAADGTFHGTSEDAATILDMLTQWVRLVAIKKTSIIEQDTILDKALLQAGRAVREVVEDVFQTTIPGRPQVFFNTKTGKYNQTAELFETYLERDLKSLEQHVSGFVAA